MRCRIKHLNIFSGFCFLIFFVISWALFGCGFKNEIKETPSSFTETSETSSRENESSRSQFCETEWREHVRYITGSSETTVATHLGDHPLHQAVFKNQSLSSLQSEALLSAEFNVLDNWQATSLHWAAACNQHVEVVKGLISELQLDVGAKDYFGQTPLHWAIIHKNSKEIVSAIIAIINDENQNSSTSIDETDSLGRTALHYAAIHGSELPIIEALLSAGANVNAQDTFGKTALHYATIHGSEPIIEALSDRSTDSSST